MSLVFSARRFIAVPIFNFAYDLAQKNRILGSVSQRSALEYDKISFLLL